MTEQEQNIESNRYLDLRFDLQTPRDLLAKLHREFERFDNEPTADHLFNFVVTAHSLTDWLDSAWVASVTGGRERPKQLLDELRAEIPIRVCRDISNGSKHFHVDLENKANKQHPPIVTDANVHRGYGWGRYGHGPYGIGEPSYTVSVEGQEIDMLQITRNTIELFAAFFEEHAL